MQNKLKILEGMDVYLPDMDGVINCLHNYSLNSHNKAKWRVMVPKHGRKYVDNQPYEIVRCKSTYIPVLGDYYGMPGIDATFKKKIEEEDYDIIHLHSPFNMMKYGIKLAKKKHIPVVATFHSNMRPIYKSLFKFDFIVEPRMHRFAKLYNQLDEVFVCSPLVEQQIRSYGYTGKITYLPFGSDFEKCPDIESYRKQGEEIFKIEKDELIFIYVGRLMKLKRIDFILEALKIVKDKGLKFRFYIVGKGSYQKTLERLVSKLGLEKEVIFTGYVPREHFAYIYARADLLLFPSLYDNFGLVKVEGAAYYTPGLFIEGSCAGYEIENGVNGYLSQDNVEDFAKQILSAASDRNKLKEVGEKAASTLYMHWSTCSDILLKRLEEIVKEWKYEDKK